MAVDQWVVTCKVEMSCSAARQHNEARRSPKCVHWDLKINARLYKG